MIFDPHQKDLIDALARELEKPDPRFKYPDRLLTHCRDCGEFFSYYEGINMLGFLIEIFPEEYVRQFAEIAYCANCDTIQQTRRRQKEAEPYEQCTIAWRKAEDGRTMVCDDSFFTQCRPSKEAAEKMTAISDQNASRHLHHRLRRSLSGPLFQEDAPLLAIVFPKWIPKMGKSTAIAAFSEMLKRKREEPIEMQFHHADHDIIVTSFTRADVIWNLRHNKDIPDGTTVWRWNNGSLYQLREWT